MERGGSGGTTLWTIPNLLSFYRLVAAPMVLVLVDLDRQCLFASLFLVSLISDILDGLNARLFHLQTPLRRPARFLGRHGHLLGGPGAWALPLPTLLLAGF
ncbi:CDP-alcohol phosphatidyltransferase family protein [Synechococcus sp. CS-1328]|uniref:CDP-alcohol phosphatidyltransferase family protein n=1 Tax=Synechococcus sp. CS-1328 TaxID=2847976 RepID=UPI00223BF08B|nr:CDP-alcohol phosphatidyltransferase family protein [Synechococcus sp. CS-1328]MCT0223765.1 CDP-alcohol phosphatidyltransferase family protein [Synechococcus sp. CS-1328]